MEHTRILEYTLRLAIPRAAPSEAQPCR
jgi:hypothetical protein